MHIIYNYRLQVDCFCLPRRAFLSLSPPIKPFSEGSGRTPSARLRITRNSVTNWCDLVYQKLNVSMTDINVALTVMITLHEMIAKERSALMSWICCNLCCICRRVRSSPNHFRPALAHACSISLTRSSNLSSHLSIFLNDWGVTWAHVAIAPLA